MRRRHTVWMTLRGRRVRCHVLDASKATEIPLLLIHGLAGSADVWGPTLGCLQRLGRTALAPDLPGSGYSDGSEGPRSIEEMADWVLELLEARGISQAHIVAHSLGCQVALALARRYPGCVVGMTLAGPTLGHEVPLWRYALGVVDVLREPPLFNVLAFWMFLQMGLERYGQAVQQMHCDDPGREIGSVHAPCLILRGTYDAVIPEASARAFAARLPLGRFQAISKAPHVVPYTDPQALLRHALPFFDAITKP